MNKRLFSIILSFVLIFSFVLNAYAIQGDKSLGIDEEIKGMHKVMTTTGKSFKDIVEKNKKEYIELGIYEYLKNKYAKQDIGTDNENVTQEIYVGERTYKELRNKKLKNNEDSDPTILSTNLGTYNVGTYNGYSMRYVLVKDHTTKTHDIYNDYANNLYDAITAGLYVGLGFQSPWLWVPATILGLTSQDIVYFINGHDENKDNLLTCHNAIEMYTKIYEIEDLDDIIPDYEWYAYAGTDSWDMTALWNSIVWDDNDNSTTKQNTVYKTVDAEHFYDIDWMKEKVYKMYKRIDYQHYNWYGEYPYYDVDTLTPNW